MPERSTAVFLSYASEDSEAVARIAAALRAAGIEVWFDKSELRGGDAWDQMIRGQIRDCALFVPVISANTVARPEGYFRLEWSLGEERSHMMARNRAFIVPVCLDSTPESGADVPRCFQAVQWTRLKGGDTPPAFCARIAQLLGLQTPAETASATRKPPLPAGGSMATGRRPPARLALYGAAALAALLLAVLAFRQFGGPGTGGAAAPDRSVAVLPFANLSSNADDEYLADGLADTLLTMLAKNNQLKVIARTSSFSFKGKNEDVRSIGQKLGVAALLEGSVQHAGDRLRVVAQLIDTRDGSHLWSETYDRMMVDVFAVQDEIASKVATALNASLMAPRPAEAGGLARHTPPLEAYQEYLKGRQAAGQATLAAIKQAQQHFQRALQLDPQYALAEVRYAGTLAGELFFRTASTGVLAGDEERSAMVKQARDLLNHALSLEPDLALAYTTLGRINNLDRDTLNAQSAFRHAFELDPNDAEVLMSYASSLSQQGKREEALRYVQKAAGIDPLQIGPQAALAGAAFENGDIAEVRARMQKMAEIAPQSVLIVNTGLGLAAATGRFDELPAGLSAAPRQLWGFDHVELRRALLGDPAAARQIVDKAVGDLFIVRSVRGMLYRQLGELQQAEAQYQRGAELCVHCAFELMGAQLAQGRPDAVLETAEKYVPGLLKSPAVFSIVHSEMAAAIVAAALRARGENEKAAALLAAAEPLIRARPRSYYAATFNSFTLVLARLLAVQGRKQEALSELRKSVDAGDGFNWWLWSTVPEFDSIRGEPAFSQCVEIVKARNAKQLEVLRRQASPPGA